MNLRELGRGWILQTWEDQTAMPRLACSRNGAVLVLDADDDLVIEVEPGSLLATNWGVIVPMAMLRELIAVTDVYRKAAGGRVEPLERRP